MNLEKILQQNIYHVMSKYIDISNQYENVLADTVKLTGQKTDPQSHLQRFDNILPRLAVAVLVNRPSLKIVDLTLLVILAEKVGLKYIYVFYLTTLQGWSGSSSKRSSSPCSKKSSP